VLVAYVRDKGSANLFPGHLYYIYLSLITADVFVTYVRDKVQPTYSLDIYIIFISLFTGDVFVTYVRDKGSEGHKHISCNERDKYYIDVQGIGWLNPCL
jgi:hypothetical protein